MKKHTTILGYLVQMTTDLSQHVDECEALSKIAKAKAREMRNPNADTNLQRVLSTVVDHLLEAQRHLDAYASPYVDLGPREERS